MATGKPPFYNLAPVTALFRIGSSSAVPDIPTHLSAKGKDFLALCFRRDVTIRPTASDLLQHPWITEIDEASSPTISTTFDTKTLAFQHESDEAPKVQVIEAPIPRPMPKNPKGSNINIKKTSSSNTITTSDSTSKTHLSPLQLDPTTAKAPYSTATVIDKGEEAVSASPRSKKKSPRRSTHTSSGTSSSSPRQSTQHSHDASVATMASAASTSTAGYSDSEDDGFGSILDFVSSRAGE